MSVESENKRLASLDVLRGLDMFVLVFLGAFIADGLAGVSDAGWIHALADQHRHASWTGLYVHDLIMPLFVFMSGTAIPFAMAKYRGQGRSGRSIYLRILKRVLVLWILGMICQGNLLMLDPSRFKFYSNTLQSIAVGYAFSCIFFLNTRPRTQVLIAAGLLVVYWACCEFITVDGFGGGSYMRSTNFPEWVDRVVLGRFCDHAYVNEAGQVVFQEGSTYTWVFSSLNFIATAMTGMFAGEILGSPWDERKKMLALLGGGILMLVAGQLWSIEMPVIKHIWTSTMVLITSGIFFILLAAIYFWVDYRKWKGLGWLKVIGVNCIFVYMMQLFSFSPFSDVILQGVREIVSPEWYRVIRMLCNFLILWVILKTMYKHKIIIRA